jgi:hypothetical protein
MKSAITYIRKVLLISIALGTNLYLLYDNYPFPTELNLYAVLLGTFSFSMLFLMVSYFHFFGNSKKEG